MTKGIRRLALSLIAAVSLLCTGAIASQAQTGSADAWSKLGSTPPTLYSIASDPSRPGTLYALSTDGLSVSSDSGASWKVCARDTLSIKVVAPQAGQSGTTTLYSMGPGGLRQSTDGCQTWKDVSSSGLAPSSSDVRSIAAHPGNTATLFAGMDGLGGLYRSTDSGASWEAASKGLPPGAWLTALTADPRHPERVIAGVKYIGRDHPPAYVYASTDGGLTWRSSSLGMHLVPHNGGEIVGLGWSGENLFAASADDGLFVSTDRGATWSRATMPRNAGVDQRPALPGAPAHAPMPLEISAFMANAEGALMLSTPQGVYRSLDGAQSWQDFGPADSGQAVAMSLDAGNHVLLAGDKTIWGLNMPTGVVSIPTQTAPAVAQAITAVPPPPPLPTNTPSEPTDTPTAQPTPTATIPARPPGYLPTDKAQPADPAIADYFEQTGHNVKYGFRDYWRNNDGIHLLGYPISEEFVENGVTVQYFERARLEYHNGQVTWGLLGTELTKGHFYQTVRFFPSEDTRVYFGPTQHSVSGPFLTFWRDNGGLDTFGYPLSESFNEDGSDYQWFERARFEWHPWFPEGHRIVLGNIGTEYLQKLGWLK